MIDPPLVSIVTPCLNPGPTLARCVGSVAAQGYPRLEHVVIDGGSLDGTLEFLGTAGVRWISEADTGQADAINKGFRLANGEIVGWLNADDELLPGAIDTAVEALTSGPDAGWVYGDCEIIEGGSPHLRRADQIEGVESFFERNPAPQPGTLVTRIALERVGPLDDTLELAMDFDLWLRLVTAGYPGVQVDAVLARFEISPSSKTGTVPWSDFLREEAIALGKGGHRLEAGLKLGAAAAWAATASTTGRPGLRSECRAATEWAGERGLSVQTLHVRAGAAETATRLGASSRRFAHLLRPELWAVTRTRATVLSRLSARSAAR